MLKIIHFIFFSVCISCSVFGVYVSSVPIKAERHRTCIANVHTSMFVYLKSYCHRNVEQCLHITDFPYIPQV